MGAASPLPGLGVRASPRPGGDDIGEGSVGTPGRGRQWHRVRDVLGAVCEDHWAGGQSEANLGESVSGPFRAKSELYSKDLQ
jgi:hypothetical protein